MAFKRIPAYTDIPGQEGQPTVIWADEPVDPAQKPEYINKELTKEPGAKPQANDNKIMGHHMTLAAHAILATFVIGFWACVLALWSLLAPESFYYLDSRMELSWLLVMAFLVYLFLMTMLKAQRYG